MITQTTSVCRTTTTILTTATQSWFPWVEREEVEEEE